MLEPTRWLAPTVVIALFALYYPGHADAAPADVVLGHWTLVSEKANSATPGVHCTKSEILFQPEAETWVDGGKTFKTRVLGYGMSGADVHVVEITGAEDAYKIINNNKIEYEGTFADCTYSRIH